LKTAAQSLAKNLAQQSVHVIQHKYGTDASRLADNAINSAGNVAMATYNIQGLKVTKTIAKATAKETIRTFAHGNDQDCPQEPSTNNFKSSEIKK
jgi:spartin